MATIVRLDRIYAGCPISIIAEPCRKVLKHGMALTWLGDADNGAEALHSMRIPLKVNVLANAGRLQQINLLSDSTLGKFDVLKNA